MFLRSVEARIAQSSRHAAPLSISRCKGARSQLPRCDPRSGHPTFFPIRTGSRIVVSTRFAHLQPLAENYDAKMMTDAMVTADHVLVKSCGSDMEN